MGAQDDGRGFVVVRHQDRLLRLEWGADAPAAVDPRLWDGLLYLGRALAVRGHTVSRIRLRLSCAAGSGDATQAEVIALDEIEPLPCYLQSTQGRELVKAVQGIWEEWEHRMGNAGPHFVREFGRLKPEAAPPRSLRLSVVPTSQGPGGPAVEAGAARIGRTR